MLWLVEFSHGHLCSEICLSLPTSSGSLSPSTRCKAMTLSPTFAWHVTAARTECAMWLHWWHCTKIKNKIYRHLARRMNLNRYKKLHYSETNRSTHRSKKALLQALLRNDPPRTVSPWPFIDPHWYLTQCICMEMVSSQRITPFDTQNVVSRGMSPLNSVNESVHNTPVLHIVA